MKNKFFIAPCKQEHAHTIVHQAQEYTESEFYAHLEQVVRLTYPETTSSMWSVIITKLHTPGISISLSNLHFEIQNTQ